MKTIYLIFFWGIEAIAQNVDSTTFSSFINITFGNKYITRNEIKTNQEIDFFNYLLENDNQQIGIQARFALKNRNALTISSLLFSDLEPRNFEINYSKLVSKKIGYFANFKTYGYYFSQYPLQNLENDFTNFELFDKNVTYGYVNQPSINIGPMLYFESKRIIVESKLNFGLGYLGKFKKSNSYISRNTFEIVKVEIENRKSTYFTIIPDISISYFPILLKKSKIGIIAHGNYQNVKRSFNYLKTIRRWTSDNFETKLISGNKHHFKNLEVNFGLNWRF